MANDDHSLIALAAASIHQLTCDADKPEQNCGAHLTLAFDQARAALRTLPSAVLMIAAERARQVTAEGYTPEHDAGHTRGELAQAAAVYAIRSAWPNHLVHRGHSYWPYGWTFKPASPLRMLVKAGGLIAAEIDRRLAAGESTDGD